MRLDRRTLVKVPQVAAIFWVVKVLTTAMGESVSDYSVRRFDPVLAVVVGAVAFAGALVLQLCVRRYVAWIYWLTVAMVAVFGTMAADVLHVHFAVPYVASTTAFSAVLVFTFLAWHRVEHTVSIHTIVTLRRELFYWATVAVTFALGTAAGDMVATTFRLGYFGATVLFACLFAVPAIGWRWFRWNEVFAFWFAYVVTRPLGASIADWLGKPTPLGRGLGDGVVGGGLAVLIIVLVAYLSITKADVTAVASDDARAQ